jgi:carboxyl-terminal processing protease
MKTHPHITLSTLLLLFSLLACSLPTQVDTPSTLEPRPTILWPSATPSPTNTATATPEPSPTPTLTPSATDTPAITPTLTPTNLPLNLQLQVFEDIWQVINDTYVYPDFNGVDWDAVRIEFRQRIEAGLDNAGFYMAMYDMITRLGDEHSFYMTPEAVAEEEANYAGQHDYVGIGILLSAVPERNRAVILSVFTGSPAEAAGLQPRDAIISVDGTPILDEEGYLRNIVRGPEGTTITLVVQTPEQEERQISVTRQRITGAVPVPYSVFTTQAGLRIGYILMVTFDDSTVDEQVGEALQIMTAEGPLDGLILDNRMNGGGSSTVVEPILGYFSGGVMGHYYSRQDERPLTIRANDINGSQEVPLVVLVGSGTVSFGEVFAGVLQDSERAYIIGTTTDGNVELLWGYDFDDGSQMWLASETFRPSYHPEQDWEANGIIPDETVPGEFDENTLENDPPVIAAISYFESFP